MESINTKCENFKQKMIKDINESGLPISSVYYICQLLFLDIEKTYYETLKKDAETQPEETSTDSPQQDN